jgi:hypothetical protein
MPLKGQTAPPYDLPISQSAKAEAVDTTVQLTFHVNVDNSPQPVPVRIRLTAALAVGLAHDIQQAAVAAEMNSRLKY